MYATHMFLSYERGVLMLDFWEVSDRGSMWEAMTGMKCCIVYNIKRSLARICGEFKGSTYNR